MFKIGLRVVKTYDGEIISPKEFAEQIMCRMLTELGYGDGVAVYEAKNRRYGHG